jgi:hypothetical protein
LRNNISISLALSAAIAMLLLASPLVLSNLLLLQPVQAQTTMTFRTVGQAQGTDPNSGQGVGLTFDAHGTSSTSDPSRVDITNGTIQLQASPPHGQTYNGTITSGSFTNNTSGASISFGATIDNTDYSSSSDCSTSVTNNIKLSNAYGETDFSGAVECSSSSSQGGDTTSHATQPSSSSSLTGSSQGTDRGSSNSTDSSSNSKDGDSDGIPDSSDKCTHNSNPRCFKEGDTSTTTTTHEQEPSSPSSSSNRTGNQTR